MTVSRDPCGRWYVSLAVEVEAPDEASTTGSAVGLDLGITHFAVTSDGVKKIARALRKVGASRADFLHKTSSRPIRDHDLIVIEDLHVKGMVRNRRLARAIFDSGWGHSARCWSTKRPDTAVM